MLISGVNKVEKQTLSGMAVQVLLWLMLVVFSLAVLYPLLWMILGSFKTNAELFLNSWGLPKKLLWANFATAWRMGVAKYFFNSIIVCTVSTVVATIVSAYAAYPLARMKSRYNKVILLIIVAGMMLSPSVTLLPLYKLLQHIGIYNTLLAMILPDIAFRLPFTTFLIWSSFLSIPKELEQAASIDGLNTGQIFWKIIMPLSTPILSTSILLSARVVWNEFMFALVFVEDSSLRTITVGLKSMMSSTETEWTIVIAGLTIATVPIILLFLFCEKYFVHGLTAGSVKA